MRTLVAFPGVATAPGHDTVHAFAFLLCLAYPALLAGAACGDVARYRIPNSLCLALALIYPVAALLAGTGFELIAWHLGAGAVLLLVGMALFFANVFGGGDAKLIAAAACWSGFSGLPALMLYIALAGGAVALAFAAARFVIGRRVSPDHPSWSGRFVAQRRAVPYGLAIAIGGIAAFPRFDLVATLLHVLP